MSCPRLNSLGYVAIFFGNMVANWNEGRLEKKEAKEALILMCEELEQNYNNLGTYKDYYYQMLSILDSLESIDQFESFFDMDEYQGINLSFVYTFAYEVAKSSGKLANIDHEEAILISRIYLSLGGLTESIDEIKSQTLSGNLKRSEDWQRAFNFLREPIDIFLRDYSILQKNNICQ